MDERTQSHKLSGGLYVSGRPEQQQKERTPTMASRAVPYTGGDVKKSGELGKMFDIPIAPTDPAAAAAAAAAASLAPPKSTSRHSSSSGSVRSAPNSGPAAPLPPTGLITSGPASGPRRSSGQLSQLGQSEASAGAVGGRRRRTGRR
ncbi:hypothetical protein Scep_028859 [Stephania cephalantha]|uniref:Uncharacterized protein n=1 Tax=Stephania cephalantha TaxID=152367 RepID=A0AAP0EFB3_9MAGN